MRMLMINRNVLVKAARFLRRAPRSYKLGNLIKELQNDVSEVTEKLDIQEVKQTYSHAREVTATQKQKAKRASYPYNESEYVVGWEKDVQKLVQVLVGQGMAMDQDIRMVAIAGMGGSGKTTLARHLYNHSYVKECFLCCAWVFISQQWSTRHVLSEILRQVANASQGINEIKSNDHDASNEELVEKLRNVLKKKSYLVILDDVWKQEALQDILPALPDNKLGSKIIITTRNQNIVQQLDLEMPNPSYVYVPPPLDEDQGWQLLSHRIRTAQSSVIDMPSFEQLGKEMLRQCNGLPLAIMALAGILRTKASIGEWQQVRSVVRTRVMNGLGTNIYDRVEDLLALSYDDLPYYLKPCFLYLGLFPEDCQIPTGMLTRMWAAEGLVTPQQGLSLEDVAVLRLEELSYRFMIQVNKTNFKGDIKVVSLHDLLRNLCIIKAEEQGFLKIYPTENMADPPAVLPPQPRRAALHSSTSFPEDASCLRSLVLLTQSSVSYAAYNHNKDLELAVVHQKFTLLRVLNLWGISTADCTLPKEIGKLIHLRYFGLRATNITTLPRSIGGLRHLLTLDYRNVVSNNNVAKIKMPDVLWKLERLRHLYLPIDRAWSVKDGLKLHTSNNLQTFWGLNGDGRGNWLSVEVPKLSTTLKKFRVVVSTEKDLEAVFCCPSLGSEGDHGRLQTFHCELRGRVAFSQQLVKPISHHQNLHKLMLIGSIEMQPSLLLPPNLARLELKDSMLKSENPMSILGALAHLKLLKLSNFYTGSSFACELGSFPQLEELYVEKLQNLNTWRIEQGAMLCLKKLDITFCTKLEYPDGLEFITTLQQLEYFGVSKNFVQKARECGWSYLPQKLRLPQNFEAILGQCDSRIDLSSLRKLYEQLIAGVFLDNKKKRFWVVMQDDHYYNCLMVYATDLSLTNSVTVDKLSDSNTYMDYRKWWKEEESDGAIIMVLELKSHHRFVRGRFSMEDLSPNLTYRVTGVIKFSDVDSKSKTVPEISLQFVLELELPDGSLPGHEANFKNKPMNEWLDVPIGEFQTSPTYGEGVGFSIHCKWPINSEEVVVRFKGLRFEPLL